MEAAKDLSKSFPRSPFEELGGMPWLARLIDKVRAEKAGTLGKYTPYPGGINRGFLEAIGVESKALREVIEAAESDREVVDWVIAHCKKGIEAEAKKIRARLLAPIPADSEWRGELEDEKRELAAAFPGLDLSHVDNFVKVICVEEGHPIPCN